eukprot:scaffold99709_cov39-Prasinocladus_malaysianus.AAC.2
MQAHALSCRDQGGLYSYVKISMPANSSAKDRICVSEPWDTDGTDSGNGSGGRAREQGVELTKGLASL